MKLELNTIRDVLLEIEEKCNLSEMLSYSADDSTQLEFYTAYQLLNGKYVDGWVDKTLSGKIVVYVKSLTWEGHKFLDTIRSDTIFNKAKQILSKHFSSAPVTFFARVSAFVFEDFLLKLLEK